MKLLIASFEAEYSRRGEIWIENDMCDVCLKDKNCLLIDSSQDEYGPGAICLECINKAFKDEEKIKRKKE